MNRDADYVTDLRRQHQVPVFAITSDHEEIGRIQGRQLGKLLPQGGKDDQSLRFSATKLSLVQQRDRDSAPVDEA